MLLQRRHARTTLKEKIYETWKIATTRNYKRKKPTIYEQELSAVRLVAFNKYLWAEVLVQP